MNQPVAPPESARDVLTENTARGPLGRVKGVPSVFWADSTGAFPLGQPALQSPTKSTSAVMGLLDVAQCSELIDSILVEFWLRVWLNRLAQ